jgi:aspartate oxidase
MNLKKLDSVYTKILIVGGGAGGLSCAFHLEKNLARETTLINYGLPNSVLSPWNMMIKDKKTLKKEILKTGCYMNRKELVNAFVDNIPSIISELKKIGIKLKKSNIGFVPDYPLPGKSATEILTERVKEKGVKLIQGKIEKFIINQENKIIGVVARVKNFHQIILFDYLVLASGGLGGLFKYTTGSKSCDGSILALAFEAGLKLENMEFFMFHPFLMIDPRLPRVLISGEILTKMEYENEEGKPILSEKIAKALKENKHHYVFPEMIQEFYLASLKYKKIFGRLVCSDSWFEDFKKKNEFGHLFKNFSKKQLERIEIHPAFHYSIGGISINKWGQTSQENVFAIGEVAGGLHGANRIGGLAILECLVFGKLAAMKINELSKRCVSFSRSKIKKVKFVGNLGLSKKIKEMTWECLGPIKNQKSLLKFYNFLKRKQKLSSQEKLLKNIVKISLLRKNSVGAFIKENTPKVVKDKSSFIINKKIIFK